MSFNLPKGPPSCIPELEKVYGRPLGHTMLEMAKTYDQFLAAIYTEPYRKLKILGVIRSVDIISRVCDCGAVKARTTHANWCSTRPPTPEAKG